LLETTGRRAGRTVFGKESSMNLGVYWAFYVWVIQKQMWRLRVRSNWQCRQDVPGTPGIAHRTRRVGEEDQSLVGKLNRNTGNLCRFLFCVW
jgi:hypothetical protein